MANFDVGIRIGAAVASSFTSSIRGSSGQLRRLGSQIDRLERQQRAIRHVEVGQVNVGRARAAYQSAVGDLVRLRREMARTQQPSQQLRRSFEQARQRATRLSSAFGEQRERLRQARQAAERMGLSTDRLTDDNARLGRSLERLNRHYQRLGRSIRAQRDLQRQRGDMRGQLMETAALATTVALPVVTAIQFEQSVTKLGAITGRGTPEDEQNTQRLAAEARRLGETTSFSASQSVEAMTYLGMAGFNAQQIQGSTAGVLDLAQAAGTELGDTANIASNILSGFALDATQDMARVGDVLTATFTTSNTTLQSLGETMKFVAPVASSAGGEIEEVAAMVGLLGDMGIDGSMAGTVLRATFLRLSAPTKLAQKQLAELNIEVTDMDGNLRSIPELLKALGQATDQMGSADRLKAIKNIFGQEAASGVSELLKQASQGTLDDEIKQLENAQGRAAQVAKKMGDTTLGSLKRLGSALESLAISVGTLLLPAITNVAEFLAGITSRASALATEFPRVTTVIVGATTGLIALKATIVAGTLAFSFMKGGVLAVVTAYRTLAAGMALAQLGLLKFNALAIVTAARTGIITAAQWAWNVALTANPIGVVIMAIGALVAAGAVLVSYWDEVKTFFGNLWQGIKDITQSAVDWLMEAIDTLTAPFQWLMDAVDYVFGGEDEKIIRAKAPALLGKANQEIERMNQEILAKSHGATIGASLTTAPVTSELVTQQLPSTTVQHNSASTIIQAPITIQAAPDMDLTQVANEVQKALEAERAKVAVQQRSALFDELPP